MADGLRIVDASLTPTDETEGEDAAGPATEQEHVETPADSSPEMPESSDVDGASGQVSDGDLVEESLHSTTEPLPPEPLPALSRLRLHLPDPDEPDTTDRRDVLFLTVRF